MTAAERVAEYLGLASGLVLVWPALRLNKNLRKAKTQRDQAQLDTSSRIRRVRVALAEAYESPEWNWLEQVLTLTGVAVMIAPSAVRLFWN